MAITFFSVGLKLTLIVFVLLHSHLSGAPAAGTVNAESTATGGKQRVLYRLKPTTAVPEKEYASANGHGHAHSSNSDDDYDYGGGLELDPRHNTPRQRLVMRLLEPYNMIVPDSETINAEFGLSIVDLIQLDYVNQVLVTSLRLHIRWKDERLSWNSSDYDGIQRLAIPPHRVWKPTILLHNSADEGFDGAFPVSVTVSKKGVMTYNTPGIFKSVCSMNPVHFPFDYQMCSLKFGFMHDEGLKKMDLKFFSSEQYLSDVILRDYTRNNMWDIVSIKMLHAERMYTGIPVPLQDLTFTLELRRKPLYFLWALVLPILATSFALPLLLLIPTGSMERLICVFFTCEVGPDILRNFIPWNIPNTSENVTMLGKYGMLVSGWGFVVMLESVLQMWWMRRKDGHGRMTGHPNTAGHTGNGITGPKSVNANPELTTTTNMGSVTGSGNVPSSLDKILALGFYVSITAYISYLLMTMPYWQDSRSHF